MRLTKSQYDTQVVEAEPEVVDFSVSAISEEILDSLSEELEKQFTFDINPVAVNWDRKKSYPEDGVEYSYHANLYRQLLGNPSVLTLSWIQAMDLAYIADELGYDDLATDLNEFAKTSITE